MIVGKYVFQKICCRKMCFRKNCLSAKILVSENLLRKIWCQKICYGKISYTQQSFIGGLDDIQSAIKSLRESEKTEINMYVHFRPHLALTQLQICRPPPPLKMFLSNKYGKNVVSKDAQCSKTDFWVNELFFVIISLWDMVDFVFDSG